jgi:hypothetical protein
MSYQADQKRNAPPIHMSLCATPGKIVVVDSDPDFAVLNLAQAVLVCCYELYPLWRRELRSPSNTVSGATPAAAKGAPGRRSSAAADSGSICDADNPGYETSGSSSDFDFDHLRGADGYGSFGGSSDGSGGDGGSIRGGGVGGVEDTLGSLQGPAAASTGAVSSGLASRPDLANAQELASMADSEGFLQRLFAELDAAGARGGLSNHIASSQAGRGVRASRLRRGLESSWARSRPAQGRRTASARREKGGS